MKIKVPPWLMLLFLAPAIGELLSGSAPPAEFFSPFGFTILLGLYGCGGVIVRELKIRWGKGVGSVLLLGTAYGIVEEGLMVSSFFNPEWQDLGILSEFGRWMGVNWVWAVELTIYHAVVSITIPILLVEMAYPAYSDQTWVGKRLLTVISLIFVLDLVFGFFLFSNMLSYWPPALPYIITIFLGFSFVCLAYKLPPNWARRGTIPPRRPRFYFFVGLLSALVCATIFGILPNLSDAAIFPAVVIFFGLVFFLSITGLLRRFDWRRASAQHKYSLVAGSLSLLIVLAPLQELDSSRLDNTSGMSLVGLFFLIGLIALRRKIRTRS